MSFEIEVENIKCGGCTASIVKGLHALEGVTSASVDVERGCVAVEGDVALRPLVAARLQQLGYPEVGSVDIFDVKYKDPSANEFRCLSEIDRIHKKIPFGYIHSPGPALLSEGRY